jgi:hypothetical protein
MRASEITKKQLKTFVVKIKLRQTSGTTTVDTTIMARNPEQARQLLRKQYGDRSIVVGQPRELK